MTLDLQFHFDFGSPNAYFVHRVIPDIEMRTGAHFAYVPVLLGGIFKATGNQAPMIAFAGIRNKLDYQSLEIRRFIQRYGTDAFRMNTHFPVNTLQIMRAAVAAEEEGVLPLYVETVFQAMWEKSEKMADPAAIAEATVARGTFGIPTIFVNDEIYFGKDTVRDVEEEIVRVQQAEAERAPVREFP